MRQYPIWNEVEACIYKSSKSFGARDTSQTTVNVGTSRSNSVELCRHVTTRRETQVNGVDFVVFKFGVSINGELNTIAEKYMRVKDKAWFDSVTTIQESVK